MSLLEPTVYDVVMDKFLELFKDPLFVSIPFNGGAVTHSKSLKKILDMNDATFPNHSGAYFTVNGFANFEEGSYHGRTKAKVTSFNANFLDIDLTPELRRTQAEAIYAELDLLKFKPTAVVLTGKGLHVYWLYKNPVPFSEKKLGEYEILQNAIIEHYRSRGADKQARDVARVLRLPDTNYYDKVGTLTCKTELLYFNPEQKYEPVQIADFFKGSMQMDAPTARELVSQLDTFDLASVLNVKAGSRHHNAYSCALSIIQQTKDLTAARKVFQAFVGTWEGPLDWNDYWRQFESAKKFIEADRPQAFITDSDKSPVSIMMAEDVVMVPVEWLWDGFIAKGKAHMLTGEPGLGKSQITTDIAARLSNGTPFPSYLAGATAMEPTGVLILSAEDDAADTMKPRLVAAGANMANIGFINSAVISTSEKRGTKSKLRALALKEDAEAILDAISKMKIKVSLIIIDPVSAFLSGDQDSNSNSDARGTLAQLQATIMSKGIAMLMINHTNKNTAAKSAHMRSMGSVGWNAAARATFYVFKDEKEGRRVFSIGKTNLAKETGKGFFYTIDEVEVQIAGEKVNMPRIKWNEKEFPVKSADEYSSGSDRVEKKSSECEDELALFMVGKAEVDSKVGLAHMMERGFTRPEVYRAARKQGLIGEYGKWRALSP